MTMEKLKFCVRRSAYPWITQQHFVGMLQAARTDQVDLFFSFSKATVLPLRTAWIADILSQASLHDVQRQRCWKRGIGDEYGLWDNTAPLAIFQCSFSFVRRC